MKRKFVWAVIPLLVLAVLVAVFAFGIDRDPRAIPSPLIGQPVPAFSLSTLNAPDAIVTSAELPHRVLLINVFASWCASCTVESEALDWLAKQGVLIYGLDYSDRRDYARAWLEDWGNPYEKVLFDPQGEAAVAFGIYGVPETFVVDASGRVRHKFTGAISVEAAKKKVLPLVRKLEAES
ncbi:MAG: DsbE family thiol:disulfide interchange protein [Gammaproteobacteria bacterium]|nr:DsbE family thiol:disulfide interchange protein [Gammaproteobacteria bacterium]